MTEVWSDQKKAFLSSRGHALALGGPGSGKTHVALVKTRDIIRAGTLKPGQKILFLSFARPTVARILEKASELTKRDELRRLEISTYHGFAWGILRSHGYLLNGRSSIELLPPPEAAAHLADVHKDNHEKEKARLFEEEGRLHFDLFARLVAQLFDSSQRLARMYSDAYPIVILDEFQDTNEDEWAMIRQVGQHSRLIALGDPDQRIYEFRGADPRRLGEFVAEFKSETFDFAGENHRNSGTDITTFGNDLLTGANKGKAYANVAIVRSGFYAGRHPHFPLKVQLLGAWRRLRTNPSASVVVLVPSKALMLQVSDYLLSDADKLPSMGHDVAMDTEPPALAAVVIAALLEGGASTATGSRLLTAVHTHIRGRRGSRPTPQAELDLAGAVGGYLSSGKVKGKKRELLVNECLRLANEREHLSMSGDSEGDWLRLRAMLANSAAEHLVQVAKDARFLRLLHRGSLLRTTLSELWKRQGNYVGAEQAVRDALVQEHFAAAQKEWRGTHLMTIHKSKGKEFDEVLVYEDRHRRIVRNAQDERAIAQDRLALRVAVTRAIRRATIVTPASDPCPLL